jgi:hypothetical protein
LYSSTTIAALCGVVIDLKTRQTIGLARSFRRCSAAESLSELL